MTRFSLQRVLAVVAGLLAVSFVVVGTLRVVHPDTLSSARAATTQSQDREREVTSAARAVTLAFLAVDYRDMEPLVKKVLKLSTGTFKDQYEKTSTNLVAAARQGHAVSSGSIRYVGISHVDESSARVFVAADSDVTNLAMQQAQQKGQKVDDQRYYRFQLDLTRVDGDWLLSDLQFVP